MSETGPDGIGPRVVLWCLDADREVAGLVTRTLTAEGLTVVGPDAGGAASIVDALDAGDYVAFVLSAASRDATGVAEAWSEAVHRTPPEATPRLWPIRVDEITPWGWFVLASHVDLVGLDEDAAAERLATAVRIRRREIEGRDAVPFPEQEEDPSRRPWQPVVADGQLSRRSAREWIGAWQRRFGASVEQLAWANDALYDQHAAGEHPLTDEERRQLLELVVEVTGALTDAPPAALRHATVDGVRIHPTIVTGRAIDHARDVAERRLDTLAEDTPSDGHNPHEDELLGRVIAAAIILCETDLHTL